MSTGTKTLERRGSKYGKVEDVAHMNEQLMAIVAASPNNNKLTATHNMCLNMIFHKIARMLCGDANYEDNAHDIAGYALLLEKYIKEINNAKL